MIHHTSGHACPAQKENKIGRWLSDIRGLYLKNRLSAAEIEALEALGVVFDSMQVCSMLRPAIALAH